MGILDKIFRNGTDALAGILPVPVDDRPLPFVNGLVIPLCVKCHSEVDQRHGKTSLHILGSFCQGDS